MCTCDVSDGMVPLRDAQNVEDTPPSTVGTPTSGYWRDPCCSDGESPLCEEEWRHLYVVHLTARRHRTSMGLGGMPPKAAKKAKKEKKPKAEVGRVYSRSRE